ncbi:hypothetical protein Tco_0735696 [Tanacetum coccineum]
MSANFELKGADGGGRVFNTDRLKRWSSFNISGCAVEISKVCHLYLLGAALTWWNEVRNRTGNLKVNGKECSRNPHMRKGNLTTTRWADDYQKQHGPNIQIQKENVAKVTMGNGRKELRGIPDQCNYRAEGQSKGNGCLRVEIRTLHRGLVQNEDKDWMKMGLHKVGYMQLDFRKERENAPGTCSE